MKSEPSDGMNGSLLFFIILFRVTFLLLFIYNRNTKNRDIPFNRRYNGKRTVHSRYADGSKTGAVGSDAAVVRHRMIETMTMICRPVYRTMNLRPASPISV